MPTAPGARESDELSRVFVQPLGSAPQPQPGSDGTPRLALAPTLADGLHTVDAGGSAYRVMVRTFANGERIAVAQEAGMRDDVARKRVAHRVAAVDPRPDPAAARRRSRAQAVPPGGRAVRRHRCTRRARPAPGAGRARAGRVRPFVVAINRMLERVAGRSPRSIASSPMPRELRSPLWRCLCRPSASPRPTCRTMRAHGSPRCAANRPQPPPDRAAARARAGAAPAAPPGDVSVHAIYRRVLEDLMPLADAKPSTSASRTARTRTCPSTSSNSCRS